MSTSGRLLNQAPLLNQAIPFEPAADNPDSPVPRLVISSQSLPPSNAAESLRQSSRLDAPPVAAAITNVSIPTYCVPHLPIKGHTSADSLYDIIHQWEHEDPKLGLPVALKDWPADWIDSSNRRSFSSIYNLCKQIALEYIERYVLLVYLFITHF